MPSLPIPVNFRYNAKNLDLMKYAKLILISTFLLSIASCKDVKRNSDKTKESINKENDRERSEANETDNNTGHADMALLLKGTSDSDVKGRVWFTEADGKVEMKVVLSGLTQGPMPFTFTKMPTARPMTGNPRADHWNPTEEPHGQWGDENGYHKGDIGNFIADSEGRASLDFGTDQWCLDCDDEKKNIIGKAVIVHEGADDYTSQPSGNAGERVACSAIVR